MSLDLFLVFLATETLLCLTPGPAVLFVIANGLGGGMPRATAAGAGILAANALCFAVPAMGIGALLVASYEAFFLVKWIGAAYLVWLGIQAWRARGPLALRADDMPIGGRLRRAFADGFVLQMANPKAILFFAALLPQFVEPSAPVGLQLAILGIASIAVEFVVLTAYGALVQRARRVMIRPTFVTWTNRASGGLLLAAGALVAAMRRP